MVMMGGQNSMMMQTLQVWVQLAVAMPVMCKQTADQMHESTKLMESAH